MLLNMDKSTFHHMTNVSDQKDPRNILCHFSNMSSSGFATRDLEADISTPMPGKRIVGDSISPRGPGGLLFFMNARKVQTI